MMDNHLQETQRGIFRTIFKEKELWILILVGVLYFYRPLFMRETFYDRDLYQHFFLRKQLLVDFIRSHTLPLWDTYLNGGQAYVAEPSNSVFYISNVLFLGLPLINAFNVNIILHFICCSAFTYFCARTIGLRPVSSFIAGIIYGFCGYTLSLGNLLGFLMAMPHLPLLLACWHLYLLEGKKKWFILTAIVGVIQAFAGAPEMNVMSLVFLLGWTTFFPYPLQAFRTKCARWVLLGIGMIGLASIQIFPTVEMLLLSSRRQGVDFASFGYWSFYLERLPELCFPGFLGYPTNSHISKETYWWGTKLFAEPRPYIFSIYFGCITMFLAIVGGFQKRDDQNFPFRVRVFLISFFVLSVMLSLGRFLPLFSVLYQFVPFLKLFRFPIKFLIGGILPISLLAGYASEILYTHETILESGIMTTKNPARRGLLILWGILAVLLLFTTVFVLSDRFADSFQNLFFKQSGNVIRRGFERACLHCIVIWLAGTLLYQYRHFRKRPWQHWLLAGIIMLDLLIAGKSINSYAPQEFFTIEPPIPQIIRREIGDGRLYRYPQYALPDNAKVGLQIRSNNPMTLTHRDEDRATIILQVPSHDPIWLYRWDLEVLSYYLAGLYRLPVIYHDDFTKLAQARLVTLKTLLDSLSWEQRLPFLSAGGVTLILTSENLSVPGIQQIQQLPDRSNLPLYLYRNTRAAKRLEFITDWKLVTSDDETLEMMLHPDYDPREFVVLQNPESTLFSPFLNGNGHIEATPQPCQDLQVKLDKKSENSHSASFSVANSCDGYIVFSEPYYPGWHVSVDGTPVTILRANYLFSAVFLKAGKHHIERFYRPNSLIIGALSTLIFCGMLFLVASKGWI